MCYVVKKQHKYNMLVMIAKIGFIMCLYNCPIVALAIDTITFTSPARWVWNKLAKIVIPVGGRYCKKKRIIIEYRYGTSSYIVAQLQPLFTFSVQSAEHSAVMVKSWACGGTMRMGATAPPTATSPDSWTGVFVVTKNSIPELSMTPNWLSESYGDGLCD